MVKSGNITGDIMDAIETGSFEILPPLPLSETEIEALPPLPAVPAKSAAEVGRDEDGDALPHVRNEHLAKLVAYYMALGATEKEIAFKMNLRPGQLRRYYNDELEHGASGHHMKVAAAILKEAVTGENMRASIFYAKARMGWRDGDADHGNQSPLSITIHM